MFTDIGRKGETGQISVISDRKYQEITRTQSGDSVTTPIQRGGKFNAFQDISSSR